MTVGYEYNGEKPLNREPDLQQLVSSFITEKDGYDRNHSEIPQLSAESHTVRVDGAVKLPITLTVSQLQNDYPQHEVICALQCAGNRRHTMRTMLKEVDGIDWFDGAVMNCKWKGPRLSDILKAASMELDGAKKKGHEGWHVAFACHSTPCQEDSWYGGSIPLERAMREDADVILALEMNDEPLAPKHGFPVRVVTPGIAGARSVKWLDRITVQRQESPNYYQQHDYKILPPEATDAEEAKKYWHIVPAIQDMPVNSVVAIPGCGSTVTLDKDSMVEVKGYALPSGSNGPIVRVEVSGDEGKTWTDAELLGSQEQLYDISNKWAWTLWKAHVKVEKGKNRRILSRATDKGGNKQEKERPEWNLRGVGYNGYGEARELTVL